MGRESRGDCFVSSVMHLAGGRAADVLASVWVSPKGRLGRARSERLLGAQTLGVG